MGWVEIFVSVVLPIILSGTVTFITLAYQEKKNAPTRKAEVLNVFEDITGGLAQQLHAAYAEIRELRDGIQLFIYDYEARGLPLPWRPNGTTVPKDKQ